MALHRAGQKESPVVSWHTLWVEHRLFSRTYIHVVCELVIPHLENCASTWTNQMRGLAGQNGGKCVATVETIVGSSKDISVTVLVVSCQKRNVVEISSRSTTIAVNKTTK